MTTDEEKLHQLSLECEPAGSAPSSAPIRKRHPSPTLSTTSSASSTSEGKKGVPKVIVGFLFIETFLGDLNENAEVIFLRWIFSLVQPHHKPSEKC